MNTTHSRLHPLAAFFAALIALTLAAPGTTAASTGVAAASRSSGDPSVTIEGGAVRGVAVPGGYAFPTSASADVRPYQFVNVWTE